MSNSNTKCLITVLDGIESDIEDYSDHELPLSSIISTNDCWSRKHEYIDTNLEKIKSEPYWSDDDLPTTSIGNVLLPNDSPAVITSESQNLESIDCHLVLNDNTCDVKHEEIIKSDDELRRNDDSKNKYECDICGQIFLKRTLIIIHFRSSLCFPECSFPFENNSFKHDRYKNNGNLTLSFHKINNSITYCKKNELKRKNGQTLVPHNKFLKHRQILHTKEDNLQCDVCSKSNSIAYKNNDCTEENFKCKYETNENSFTELSILKLHGFTDSENKPVSFCEYNKSCSNLNALENMCSCASCHGNFSESSSLPLHKRVNDIKNLNTRQKYLNTNLRVAIYFNKIRESYQIYECSKCSKVFNKRSAIVNHIFDDHEEYYAKYSCDKCSSLHESPREAILHLEKKKFKCEVCPQTFTSYYRLHQHYRWHIGINYYKCQYCSETFSKFPLYSFHERTHCEEKPFRCNFCDKWFPILANINIHFKFYKSFVCTICNKTFERYSSFLSHKIHSKTNQVKSKTKKNVCRSRFEVPRLYQNSRKLFKCNVCNKSFTQISTLCAHLETHNNKNVRRGKKTLRKSSSKKYGGTHLNNRRIKCNACQNTFPDQSIFINHKCISYKCKFCEKVFSTTSALQKHSENIHTDNKPFQCNICKTSFMYLTSLNRHQNGRIQCQEKTTPNVDLNNQINETNQDFADKEYKCDLCLKVFYNQSEIFTHILKTHY